MGVEFLKKNIPNGLYFIYSVLILYSMFNVFSFLWLFSSSLKGTQEMFSSSPWAVPKELVWSNYIDAWNIGNIGNYLLNSIYVTSIATFGTLFIASMAAYILGRVKFRMSNIILTFFLVAMMLPPFMIVIPLFNLLEKMSLLNSLNGLILVYITMQLPLNIFILTSFYKTIPSSMEEAAAMDGASPAKTFFKIMMPLTIPAIVACGVINVIVFWNEFLFALIFLSDKKVFTLSIGIFNLSQTADYSSNWGVLFAGMIISIFPVIILFLFFQRQFTNGISQGSVKM